MLIQLESTSGFMKSTVATYFQMNKIEANAAIKLALIYVYRIRYCNGSYIKRSIILYDRLTLVIG